VVWVGSIEFFCLAVGNFWSVMDEAGDFSFAVFDEGQFRAVTPMKKLVSDSGKISRAP
jgi:hypothetical protein